MVSLEKLFNLHDVAREPQLVPKCEYVEEVNIGIEEQPNIIKISRTLSPISKQMYISPMKEYSDVFSWSYKDQDYDTSII